MKKGKSADLDNIKKEILEISEDFGIDAITGPCTGIYKKEQIFKKLKTVVFITVPKNHKAMECTYLRAISHMSNILKKTAEDHTRGN